MLDDKLSLEQIAKNVTGDSHIKIIDDNIIPEYKCDCSREKIEKGLIAIGKKELEDIINTDGKANTVCHFCNKEYYFDDKFTNMICSLDTTNVKNMEGLFYNCQSLVEWDFANLNTANVTNMSNMFAGCSRLNGFENLELSMLILACEF